MIKPLLIPVYDINYYLPKFKSFDKNNLFNKNNNYNYTINLDIDKIFYIEKEKEHCYEEYFKINLDKKINNI